MKIAIYKNVKLNFEVISEFGLESDDYLRLTEFVDVTFDYLPSASVNNVEIDLLKKKKEEIQANAEIELTNIDNRIKNLLALPSPV